jgi:SAM-dependent methyltransferase
MTVDHKALKRSFGGVAALYDEARPDYPAELLGAIEARAAVGPLRLLEVGCGTGQATRLFAGRGHDIHATDLSAELIAVARERLRAFPNVRFTAGAFEQLALPVGAYDLVVSAQAFHWIDPAIGLPGAWRTLARGGVLALFWNFFRYDANAALAELRDLCVAHAPAFAGWPDASDDRFAAFADSWEAAVTDADCFRAAERVVFERRAFYTSDHFLKLLATYSWVLALPDDRRAALLGDMRAALTGRPEPLELPVRTLLVSAVAADAPGRPE